MVKYREPLELACGPPPRRGGGSISERWDVAMRYLPWTSFETCDANCYEVRPNFVNRAGMLNSHEVQALESHAGAAALP
jgi:hypothetical protein